MSFSMGGIAGEKSDQSFAALAAAGVLALLLSLAVLFSAAAPAAAQTPAICDEYPDLPVCVQDTGDGGDTDDDDSDEGDEAGAGAPGSGGGGGSLPFTGYPLSALLLLILILLATGIAIRGGIAIRRRGSDPGTSAQPPA